MYSVFMLFFILHSLMNDFRSIFTPLTEGTMEPPLVTLGDTKWRMCILVSPLLVLT